MLTGQPLTRFRKRLLAWFAESRRDLPWRRTKDPYRIWLSEVMLQQTRVAAVIPYYERFLAHFPDVQALANAQEEEVLRYWAGLGYYSRARNLRKAARQIVAQHDSKFPISRGEALELAGIGEYTVAAILSIAYNKKLAVLDGNVARVLARVGALRGDLRSNGRWRRLQELADRLMAQQAPGDWNEAMMELGATICTPRSPQCLLCPVTEFCEARKRGLMDVIPEKRKKRATVEVKLAALVLVDRKEHTLLLSPSRPSAKSATAPGVGALLSRMCHFPTIEVTRDAERELRAYVRKNVVPGLAARAQFLPLSPVRHTVTHHLIRIQAFRVELRDLPEVPGARELPLRDLGSVAVSNLTRKVAAAAVANAKPYRPNSADRASAWHF
jgi:A/G-specific adenine glycosylase